MKLKQSISPLLVNWSSLSMSNLLITPYITVNNPYYITMLDTTNWNLTFVFFFHSFFSFFILQLLAVWICQETISNDHYFWKVLLLFGFEFSSQKFWLETQHFNSKLKKVAHSESVLPLWLSVYLLKTLGGKGWFYCCTCSCSSAGLRLLTSAEPWQEATRCLTVERRGCNCRYDRTTIL